MALIKSVPTDFGVDATYWNIGAVQEDFKGKGMEVTLYGYGTKEARQNEKQPLAVARIAFTGDKYLADSDRAALYGAVKADPAFAESTDDI